MSSEFKPAVRENVPTLTGLAGGTGSGKTLSGMKMAKGLAGNRRFAVIDTESGRSRAYADDFQFDVLDLSAPFRPAAYLEAILKAEKAGYPAILVDSASHEYAGEGGMLDWHDELLDEFVARALKRPGESRSEYQLEEANNRRAWIEPKMEHKKYVQRLTQVRSHLILCFRAEPKTEQVVDEKTKKTVIRDKQGLTGYNGWFPICDKNMPFELTDYFLLTMEKPGVPIPIKLMDKHKPFFPLDKPITEAAGVMLAEWAKGGKSSGASAGADGAATKNSELPQAPETFDVDDIRDLETAAADAGMRFIEVTNQLQKQGFALMETVPKAKKSAILTWIAGKKKTA